MLLPKILHVVPLTISHPQLGRQASPSSASPTNQSRHPRGWVGATLAVALGGGARLIQKLPKICRYNGITLSSPLLYTVISNLMPGVLDKQALACYNF
jgi:hypothetical protein